MRILSIATATFLLGVFSVIVFFSADFAIQYYKNHDAENINIVWDQYNIAINSTHYTDKNDTEKTDYIKLANRMADIDCSKCPADFQSAWGNLVRTTSNFATHANAISVITGGIELLRARADMLAQLNEEKSDMENAQIECKRIATQHGVKFTE